MQILPKLLELDFTYLDSFTNRIDTSWGCLFHNEEQPTYFDANHAHVILDFSADPKPVINETVSFYGARNIIPRFYLFDIPEHQKLIEELRTYGFKTEELDSIVQLWNKQTVETQTDGEISIEKVDETNFDEALEIECSIKEFGGKEVREKAFQSEFNHLEFTYYLLRYNGKACCTACVFESGSQARLESVATLTEYRGKGLIGALISHIQQEVANKGLENLWVFPINETVEKIYLKYGFQTLGRLKTVHAFLGGKSVKEIREGE